MKRLLLIIAALCLLSCDSDQSKDNTTPGMSYLGTSKDLKISLYKFEYEFDDSNVCYIVRDNRRDGTSISCVPKATVIPAKK